MCPTKFREENTITNRYPTLLQEWVFEKNGRSPCDITYGSHYMAWWCCSQCSLIWQAKVYSRTIQGTGCPFCHRGTSKQQLRIYAELDELLSDVKPEYATDAGRIDIALVRRFVAIEYDGGYWHDDRYAEDKEKNYLLEQAGWTVVRVRHTTLPRIGQYEIAHNSKTAVGFATMRKLLQLIISTGRLTNPEISALRTYLRNGEFVANRRFDESLVNNMNPFGKKTVADYPEFAQEWNDPLPPEKCSTGRDYRARWTCKECGHGWLAAVHSRIGGGHGCPACARQCATPSRNLKEMFPKVAAFLICSCEKDATAVAPYSEQEQLWICEQCEGQFSKSTEDVVARFEKSGQLPHCSKCMGKIRMRDRALAFTHPNLAAQILPADNDGITAYDISYGSDKKRTFTCDKCGNKRRVTPNNLTNPHRSAKCPECRYDVLSGEP